MATLIAGKSHLIITSGLKFLVVDKSGSQDAPPQPIDLPVPAPDTKQPQPEPLEPHRILCGRLSPDGSRLALCDDHKQLTVWRTESWTLEKSWQLQRRASKVAFSEDGQQIVLADKSGDVFLFSSTSPPQLLLGHLSMLLDVTVNGKYIITCDRDEKIRVSRFPNAYNIHNYCLGHTDFVTSAQVVSPDLLLSCSGDGTLRLWKFLEGTEVGRAECWKDVGIEPEAKIGEDVKHSGVPGVIAIKCFNKDGKVFVVVSIERFNGLLVYDLSLSACQFTLLQTLQIEHSVWDYDVDEVGSLWVLQTEDNHLLRHEMKSGKFQKGGEEINTAKWKEFFEVSRRIKSNNLDELHKRWFDNVKEYMERKEGRMEATENKKRKT